MEHEYDYIIDVKWTGPEGQKFVTPTGGSFRVYSSLKAASEARVSFTGRTWVGPGIYRE